MRWFMRIAVSAERSRSQRACLQPRQSDSAARVFGIYSVKLRDQATLTPLISLYPVALGLTSAVNVSAYLVVLVGSFSRHRLCSISPPDRTKTMEDIPMSVNTKAASAPQIRQFTESQQVNQATQFAQFTLLDEVPGLIFGLMTIVYIVSSLWSLL